VPELPEVETLLRSLAPALTGRRIEAVRVRDPRLRTPVATQFAARLTGRRIEGLSRVGKYLLAALDDGHVWLIHLGMTGRLTLAGEPRPEERHDHIVVHLEDGRVLTYHDPRRFGRMDVLAPAALAATLGAGVDALSPALTAEVLFALTRRRRTSIKALLMDQRRIAGLGNIYVNEILFRAGVRPRRRTAALRRADCDRLIAAMRAVLAAAIRVGGSSISDYVDGLGRSGWFQLRHHVYDRGGEPCRRCRTPIRQCVIVGRSSFYCPRCQR
jgi:formamidopyrimidine-DNA glycosylase